MNGQQFNDKFAEFHSIDATRNLLERDRGGGGCIIYKYQNQCALGNAIACSYPSYFVRPVRIRPQLFLTLIVFVPTIMFNYLARAGHQLCHFVDAYNTFY